MNRYKNADVCTICEAKKVINGFCEHCGYTDATKKKLVPIAYNKIIEGN